MLRMRWVSLIRLLRSLTLGTAVMQFHMAETRAEHWLAFGMAIVLIYVYLSMEMFEKE